MFRRIGFIGRMMLIVLALLLAVAVIGITLSLVARERRETGDERFPVAAQAAGIIELIEATAAPARANVLKAVSTERFVVRIVDRLPEDRIQGVRLPGVEWLVGQYLGTLPDREIVALRIDRDGAPVLTRVLDRLQGDRRQNVSIAVALRGGGYVLFDLKGGGTLRVFGIPVGFWIGLFGSLFAAVALWAIAREARPLSELAAAVERFSHGGEPQLVAPRGAPELRHLVAATNDMQGRIASLLKGRTMLLGAISHDLKTYITRLRLRAESIEPEDARERTTRDLDEMTALIDNALAVARGATVSDRKERLDLAALATDEVTRRQDSRVELGARHRATGVIVEGDGLALRRAAANLIDNACQHGKRCRVSVQKRDDVAVLSVEDDGPGIPESERGAVFEPFYRIEPSRSRATGGSGLGLAIARQIIEAHSGTIAIDTSELGGAAVIVNLPAPAA